MLRLLTAGLVALALPLAAGANATVDSIKGAAQAGGAPVSQGQRLFADSTITTGPGGQLALRFDDGMQLVLGENSLLRVVDFTFAKGRLADRVVLDLLKGSVRVATGSIAQKNPKEFFLRAPQAQFGVQGPADFTVALVNPAYLAVAHGTVLAANGAGTVAFGAGATASIASNVALAAAIPASAFPTAAASAMGNLSVAAVTTPAAGGAAAGAAAASWVAPVALGASVAAIAAAAAKGASASSSTHTPSSHSCPVVPPTC